MESIISLGPCGGSGGSQWKYLPKGEIRQIEIFYGSALDSITFKHDKGNGFLEDSKKFGGQGGGQNKKIYINSPSEYLTCISGTVGKFGGHTVIKSVCFVTNLNTNGPFGSQEGTPFSLPIIRGTDLVGFHGNAGDYIDCFGVYVKHKCSESFISVGPFGGSGGGEWIYTPKGDIKQIEIFYGSALDSIKFKHDKGNGLLEDSKRFGGQGGGQNKKIDINSPCEYLTCISGTVGQFGGHTVIKSVCFVTNLNTNGPFGSQEGTPFSMPIMEGTVLVGFHGKAGAYIDSIGVYLKKKPSGN